MRVRIQVIKAYDIDVPDECDDPIAHVYGLQTTEIEETGKLVDAMTDHAETEEQVEANLAHLQD